MSNYSDPVVVASGLGLRVVKALPGLGVFRVEVPCKERCSMKLCLNALIRALAPNTRTLWTLWTPKTLKPLNP